MVNDTEIIANTDGVYTAKVNSDDIKAKVLVTAQNGVQNKTKLIITKLSNDNSIKEFDIIMI